MVLVGERAISFAKIPYPVYSVAELYEYAMQPEHLSSVDPTIYPTTISDVGALSVSSGSKTGRTPKEKRVVLDENTKDVSIHLFLKIIKNKSDFANIYSQTLKPIRFIDHLVGQCEHPYLSPRLRPQQKESS